MPISCGPTDPKSSPKRLWSSAYEARSALAAVRLRRAIQRRAAVMINAFIILGYLLGIVLLGVYLSRYVATDSDFFLAGRSLNQWVVAGTIISTDIAAIYIVGPAGNAYEGGVPILLCGWT